MSDAPLIEQTAANVWPKHRDKRTADDICRLWFDQSIQHIAPSGDYSLRGGLCWPMTVMNPSGIDTEGVALAIATHVDTGRSVVLSEIKFRSIEHVFGNYLTGDSDTMALEKENRGLHEWLSKMQSGLGLNTYYYVAKDDIHYRWLNQIIKCKSLLLKPKLIEAPPMSDELAITIVFEKIAAGKLRYALNGIVWHALAHYAGHAVGSGTGKLDTPALLALTAAMRGIDAWPYRRRAEMPLEAIWDGMA